MNSDFLLESYDYVLSKDLIATYPVFPKEKARLLVYHRKEDRIFHSDFYHIFDFIPKKALIVFNDTKVIKARLYGYKESGGSIEILFHRQIRDKVYLVQIGGKVKKNTKIILQKGYECLVEEMLDEGYRVVSFFKNNICLDLNFVFQMLEELGHMPIPPYMKRDDETLDLVEYQSVFAKNYGAVAAPTASLHFSDSSMEYIKRNFNYCFLTLHVGAGTFNSVDTPDIREYKIHTESLHIPVSSMQKIHRAESILCIGTTALRSVEYYQRLQVLDKGKDFFGECDIFLHLGNRVCYADYLLTNFHLPKSSLIMLVASMVGLEKCKEIYEIAIQKQYRFYSYGDGMLIL
ncbi:tRNA preQ1(34) S-adenosylmethionine ribosyltransferase-isomerase QueA [Helicobacter sp. 13S00477-4]|uniref:tRNA preQ1(34) S-adenosylmethionine ribosyltransferase-isomerase QueA n=1 Tax=Helicobacter sp. 13S00477-4 TaxID=1905759 RepID=UPI000BA53CF6|nr:tRNA preQ1(34) S-adenosylmethionine ribosyltransferase-isomerase QueA [Helicobacter sp. 13S00477-4]PAF50829.1 tRNA preQ1(34) S-adenosylmethionine ribosyltransferase-isomerase QueA [Helicobacter sp. 13S00477-4]